MSSPRSPENLFSPWPFITCIVRHQGHSLFLLITFPTRSSLDFIMCLPIKVASSLTKSKNRRPILTKNLYLVRAYIYAQHLLGFATELFIICYYLPAVQLVLDVVFSLSIRPSRSPLRPPPFPLPTLGPISLAIKLFILKKSITKSLHFTSLQQQLFHSSLVLLFIAEQFSIYSAHRVYKSAGFFSIWTFFLFLFFSEHYSFQARRSSSSSSGCNLAGEYRRRKVAARAAKLS